MENTEKSSRPDTEQKIVNAAIRCFVRFGARKTAMNDIAAEAGVSRQTVYDLFRGKDELIRASIRQISDQSLQALELRLRDCRTLGEKLDAYFQETVVKSFELLQSAGDPEELISGHNQAGADAIRESHERQKLLVARILKQHIPAQANTEISPSKLANFVVSVAMSFKHVRNREELDALLGTLVQSVHAVMSLE